MTQRDGLSTAWRYHIDTLIRETEYNLRVPARSPGRLKSTKSIKETGDGKDDAIEEFKNLEREFYKNTECGGEFNDKQGDEIDALSSKTRSLSIAFTELERRIRAEVSSSLQEAHTVTKKSTDQMEQHLAEGLERIQNAVNNDVRAALRDARSQDFEFQNSCKVGLSSVQRSIDATKARLESFEETVRESVQRSHDAMLVSRERSAEVASAVDLVKCNARVQELAVRLNQQLKDIDEREQELRRLVAASQCEIEQRSVDYSTDILQLQSLVKESMSNWDQRVDAIQRSIARDVEGRFVKLNHRIDEINFATTHSWTSEREQVLIEGFRREAESALEKRLAEMKVEKDSDFAELRKWTESRVRSAIESEKTMREVEFTKHSTSIDDLLRRLNEATLPALEQRIQVQLQNSDRKHESSRTSTDVRLREYIDEAIQTHQKQYIEALKNRSENVEITALLDNIKADLQERYRQSIRDLDSKMNTLVQTSNETSQRLLKKYTEDCIKTSIKALENNSIDAMELKVKQRLDSAMTARDVEQYVDQRAEKQSEELSEVIKKQFAHHIDEFSKLYCDALGRIKMVEKRLDTKLGQQVSANSQMVYNLGKQYLEEAERRNELTISIAKLLKRVQDLETGHGTALADEILMPLRSLIADTTPTLGSLRSSDVGESSSQSASPRGITEPIVCHESAISNVSPVQRVLHSSSDESDAHRLSKRVFEDMKFQDQIDVEVESIGDESEYHTHNDSTIMQSLVTTNSHTLELENNGSSTQLKESTPNTTTKTHIASTSSPMNAKLEEQMPNSAPITKSSASEDDVEASIIKEASDWDEEDTFNSCDDVDEILGDA